MRHRLSKNKGTAVARACFFTAVVNSLFCASHAQEVLLPGEQPPVDEASLAERALQWGPFDIHPSLRGSMVYDNNIYIRPDNEEADLIWALTPSVLVGAGDYEGREANLFTLGYAPSFILFTDNTDESAIDHDAQLRAELHESKWSLSLAQGFQLLSGAVIDVGDRVDRRLFDTRGTFEYEISPKTSFDLHARQTVNDYEGLNDFTEWTFGGGADYALTPKVKLGVGTVFGFVDVRHAVNQSYQQASVRASYEVSEKLEARGSIGGEVRQFQGDQSSRSSLVFSLGGTYRPFVNTSVMFDGYRRNQTSVVLGSQNYTTTGFAVALKQLLREKYTAHVAGGYENADYTANATSVNADREDDYLWVRTGVDWDIVERTVVGVFYQYRRNSSNTAFDFTNHQVGLTASYQF